jgi:capsular polysaccharide biosynthesis protein
VLRPIRISGNALNVNSAGSQSYYHWLLDELPRLLVAPKKAYDKIICSRDSNVNREVMEVLGVDRDSLVFLDDAAAPYNHLCADLLTCPSLVAPSGEPSSLLVDLLTEFVSPFICFQEASPSKIYICRSNAPGRRLAAESELIAKLGDSGFVPIQLEALSWKQQVNLFYHAREICAPHGAGLANLAFCANRPKVIEIFNSEYVHWCFWKLTQLVGGEYFPFAFPLTGAEHNPDRCYSDIQMSASDVSMIASLARQ